MDVFVTLYRVDMIATTVFDQITFKLHMQVVDDEWKNPIDFLSRGHRSRSTLPLARGCHALRCLVSSC